MAGRILPGANGGNRTVLFSHGTAIVTHSSVRPCEAERLVVNEPQKPPVSCCSMAVVDTHSRMPPTYGEMNCETHSVHTYSIVSYPAA